MIYIMYSLIYSQVCILILTLTVDREKKENILLWFHVNSILQLSTKPEVSSGMCFKGKGQNEDADNNFTREKPQGSILQVRQKQALLQ